jgi:2-polyprenyl-3-methyl-5-hydroxy-6-metoxy-1,4-benzoquinol methylase
MLPEDLTNMRILDMGFGFGSWGFTLKTRKTGIPHIVGVEPFKPYADAQKQVKIYDEIHNMTAQTYFKEYPNEKFDVIFFTEVAEHMEKKDAIEAIRTLKKHLSRGGLLIVSTPEGRTEGAPMFNGNVLNAHLCGFNAEELKREDFEVRHVLITQYGRAVDLFANLWYLLKLRRRPVTHELLAFYRMT